MKFRSAVYPCLVLCKGVNDLTHFRLLAVAVHCQAPATCPNITVTELYCATCLEVVVCAPAGEGAPPAANVTCGNGAVGTGN